MTGTRLTGLDGTNPLGFLGGLGVQVAFASTQPQPRLWWSDDIAPRAVVDEFPVDCIVDQAIPVFREWSKGAALNPAGPGGVPLARADDLKLARGDIRVYLESVQENGPAASLSAALVAEGSVDNKGSAKPTDLYFAAGQMRFVAMARKILENVKPEEVKAALTGPWTYASKLPSFMWDVADDRTYALTANNPSEDKKLSNPGVEALAILGLSLHPVFGTRGRTLTRGCSGTWKKGHYSWPLWWKPASLGAVTSLLAHAHGAADDRRHWFRSWGVSAVLQASIRRSSQGGYGTFAPAEILWQDNQAPQ
ncbi:type I-G CRISPR-associated protein, Cas3-extension family [Candidatus Palauibacter sp.]|uniref:type I-G CRISPR-associated protein, Cas3-extension family n=1 Tax=Candidatus Palauibacter sp. TaxID=3101350 RepID=UPI003B58CBD0